MVQQAAVDPRRVACRLLAAVRLLLAAAVRLWILEGLISAPALEEPAVPAEAQATADRRRAACGLLAAALVRLNITYPVAQDNDSRTWNAYGNQYWPAQYIVDQSGKIVFQHDGEGQYEQMDRTIARLLNASS